jgi:hypothetical protein
MPSTISCSATNATRPSPWSDSDCRVALHFALSQLNSSIPEEFFDWLDRTHPNFATELLVGAVAKIELAWMTPRFEAVLADFLFAASAAVAVFQLSSQREGGDARRR